MADTGWKNPGSASSATWTNINNILTSNDVRASVPSNSLGALFTASNFGFSIPIDAVIDGIEVIFEGYDNESVYTRGRINELRVNNKGFKGTGTLTGSEANYTMGGSSDLWNSNHSASEINDSSFAITGKFDRGNSNAAGTAYCDNVRVKIYYSCISLNITTTILPDGTKNDSYSKQLYVTTPSAWSIVGGALPTGLSLSAAGLISGVPTTLGNSSFTVRATSDCDSTTDDQALTIGITQFVVQPSIKYFVVTSVATTTIPFIAENATEADKARCIGRTGSGGECEFSFVDNGSTGGGFCDTDMDLLCTGREDTGGFCDLDGDYLGSCISSSGGICAYILEGAVSDVISHILNLDTLRTYQYTNYDFRSCGRFNQILLGCKTDGLYDLETTASDDNGTDIAASFEIKTDFGLPNYKRFRNIYIEGGDAKITITDESGNVIAYNITVEEFRSLPRGTRDKAFTVKVENINGEQTTLRRLHGELDVYERKGV